MRVDRLAAGERHGHGADGEVAGGKVGLDRVAAQGGDVDLPSRAPRRDDAPGAELGGELEGMLAQLAAECLGDRPAGIARDREVEVGDVTAERRVANRPAGDPDAVAAPSQRLAGAATTTGASLEAAGALVNHGDAEAPRSCGAPRHPRRDRAGDLVVDRARAGAATSSARIALLALGADQHRLVARRAHRSRVPGPP